MIDVMLHLQCHIFKTLFIENSIFVIGFPNGKLESVGIGIVKSEQ